MTRKSNVLRRNKIQRNWQTKKAKIQELYETVETKLVE